MKASYKVMFVCLGNICRSPLAEGVFRKLVEDAGLADLFECASSGVGSWHVGEGAHPQTVFQAKKAGFDLSRHRAKQLCRADFDEFSLLVALDESVYKQILDTGLVKPGQLVYLRDFDHLSSGSREVPDPFYGGADGFSVVQDIVVRSISGLLKKLKDKVE